MNLFNVLSLICGLAFFLFGMQMMGTALEKTEGGRLEKILEKLTSSPIKGVFIGMLVTAVIQSSSATTVMVVGFVNSGIMKLSQSVGVIMGANIGTTVTAWILSLAGIESDNFFIKLFKPESFTPLFAIIGVFLIMFVKKGKKHDIGSILIGFAVLMNGMSMMSSAVKPLANVPEFAQVLLMFSNPVLGVIAGAVLTAIIQSSSASVGILQALTVTGSVTYGSAIPIIMGQNIGTCATALISCVGATKNAKRAAMVHLYFNLIGTLIFLCGFYALNAIFKFSFINSALNAADIAIIHSAFNIGSTIILFPFSKKLAKLATVTVRDSKTEEHVVVLDERLLKTPSVAIDQCKNATVRMSATVRETLFGALSLISKFDQKEADRLMLAEEDIDKYEDILGSYLVKISAAQLSDYDSREISKLLHCIGDFERIGDHAVNIIEVAQEMHDKNVTFSAEAMNELNVLVSAVKEIIELTTGSFEREDAKSAGKVEPLEQVVDLLRDELKSRHIARLRDGNCTIELGFMFADLLSNCERVSDHCSNIAVCTIQLHEDSFDTHDYLNTLKKEPDGAFAREYESYKDKFRLPA